MRADEWRETRRQMNRERKELEDEAARRQSGRKWPLVLTWLLAFSPLVIFLLCCEMINSLACTHR